MHMHTHAHTHFFPSLTHPPSPPPSPLFPSSRPSFPPPCPASHLSPTAPHPPALAYAARLCGTHRGVCGYQRTMVAQDGLVGRICTGHAHPARSY
eukprot:3868354-Rhodomonas_salina.2